MEKNIKNIPNLISVISVISCLLGSIFFTSSNIFLALSFYSLSIFGDISNKYLLKKYNDKFKINKNTENITWKINLLSLIIPSIILGNLFMILPLVFELSIFGINFYSKNAYIKHNDKLKQKMLLLTMILGLIATKVVYIHFVFLPTLLTTLKLQVKVIEKYLNEIKIKKIDYTNISNNDTKKEYNKKINENINKKIKYKTKKLIRKKDYNDRH